MGDALTEHLVELRKRLLVAVAFFLLAFLLCYAVSETLYDIAVAPLKEALGEGRQLVFLSVPELFFTYLRLSFWAGLFISLPMLLWEGWRFVAPGLYAAERRIVWPFLVATPVLFYLGGLFTYFVIMPLVTAFFIGFETEDIMALPAVGAYLTFFVKMVFAFGLAFELPVILLVLVAFGVVSVELLVKFRRYAIVCVFIAAAILTPPDPASQLLLAVPMLILYEIGLFLAKFVAPKSAV